MNKIKLGDVLDIKRGMTLPGEFYSLEGHYIRLTLGNFNYPDAGWKENTSKKDLFYVGAIRREYILKKGNIITPLTEQVPGLLGNTATIPEDNLYIQSGDIGLVKTDETKINERFVYYLLSSKMVKKQLAARSQQTKIRHTSPEAIKSCTAFIPNLGEQAEIAKILDNLNLKIEINNKINHNLEKQAKMLYDYWFTQFDFPDENGKPYRASGGEMIWNEQLKRNIPKNFKVAPFLEIASWESNSQPPKNEFIYEPKEGYVRFIQNRDYSSNNYKTYIPLTQNLSIVDRFDILMDKYGDAGIVRYGIEGAFNVALGKICVHNKGYREYIRSFLSSAAVYNYLHNSCMASTRASLNESNLAMLKILIPNEEIVLKYDNLLHTIRLQILENNDENQELIKLRDWLLPMLMNGQATISD